jgi:hypothetical protein
LYGVTARPCHCGEWDRDVISSVGPASCRSFVTPYSDPGSSLDSRVRGNDNGRDAHPAEDCFVPRDAGRSNDNRYIRESECILKHCRDMGLKEGEVGL